MPLTDPAFEKEVKKALAHWHDLAYLGDCPLARSLLPNASLSTKERGKLLQQLLQEAIECLKPSETSGEDQARSYKILHYKYVERKRERQVIEWLTISVPIRGSPWGRGAPKIRVACRLTPTTIFSTRSKSANSQAASS